MAKIIVAYCRENRVIGHNGALPWPTLWGDLARFRELTVGNTVIMGRKTWQSLPVGYLRDRQNIVLTREPQAWRRNYRSEHLGFDDDLACAISDAIGTAYIIGGEAVYTSALMSGLVDEVLATEVHTTYDGDTRFPLLTGWHEAGRETHNDFDFVRYTEQP